MLFIPNSQIPSQTCFNSQPRSILVRLWEEKQTFMKTLTAYRNSNVWTKIQAFLLSLTFMIVWLPFVRSLFDGESYAWGTNYFGFFISGNGVTPSFLFLIIQMALYALLFIGLYRMKNRKLYFGLLFIWWINVFGNLIYDIIVNGDTMFHGDTLNVHILSFYLYRF